MSYQAPLEDTRFQLTHIVAFDRLAPLYPEADLDTVMAMLDAAAKIAQDEFDPLRREMDRNPPQLEGTNVKTPAGVKAAVSTLAENGFVGISAPEEFGGLGMPLIAQVSSNEYFSATNLALELYPLLTQGQIEALEAHANEEIKAEVLPKLCAGEWSGTMLLTEPSAGSDVGALKTKAIQNDDGSFAITGQKIFITWGEHDLAANISHLTLARIDGDAEGARGISLFYVPKILRDGTRNRIACVGLEEKLGIHGSPTCVMALEGATGYLVGEQSRGLAAMFTMMNNARLNVGVQGLGVAEAAYQHALDYAKTRIQGKTGGETGAIIDYGDVRRMLMAMKAKILITRALCYDCAISIDLGKSDAAMAARAGVLTPLAKSFGTDIACEVANDGVQVFGGMGFVEETGAAQYLRDARITPIYEGTNGIQAMDLVGRKMADDGAAVLALIDEIALEGSAADAKSALLAATKAMLERDMPARGADAADYLRGFASVLGAHYLAKGALHSALYAEIYQDFAARELPAQTARLAAIAQAPRAVYGLGAEEF